MESVPEWQHCARVFGDLPGKSDILLWDRRIQGTAIAEIAGVWDQFAPATGIVRRMKKILAENEGVSQLREMQDFTAKDVCDQAKKGDPLCY